MLTASQPIAYYLGPGLGAFLLAALFPLVGYLVWRVATTAVRSHTLKTPQATAESRAVNKAVVFFLISLVLLMTVSAALITLVDTWPVHTQRVHHIAENNNRLMELDRALFGTYPTLWLQAADNPWSPTIARFTTLLKHTYFGLTPVFAVMMLVLLATHTQQFFRLLVVFFLVVYLSVPFWLALPATSPVVAYWNPALEQPTTESIQVALTTYEPNAKLASELDNLSEARVASKDEMLVLTTIPSMHIAWVVALVWYVGQAWPVTLILGIPYFLLNSISTVFLLQHYAVDTPAGVAVAAVAIVITRYLKPEKLKSFQVISSCIEKDSKAASKLLLNRQ